MVPMPTSIPKPLIDGHQQAEADIGETCDFEAGEARRAPIYLTVPNLVQPRWLLTQSEFDDFHDWYEDDLLAGSLTFPLPIAEQGGAQGAIIETEAMFLSPPVERMIHGGFWEVSAPCATGIPFDDPVSYVPPDELTWSPVTKSEMVVLTLGNLVAGSFSSAVDEYGGVRAERAKTTGKWYFEVPILVAADFMPSFGVAPGNLSDWDPSSIDVELGSVGLSLRINGDRYGLGVLTPSYAGSMAPGDTGRVAVDVDAGKLWIGVNASWLGGDPVAGTSPTFTNVALLAGGVVPAASTGRLEFLGKVRGNFSTAQLAYSPPAGFNAWGD